MLEVYFLFMFYQSNKSLKTQLKIYNFFEKILDLCNFRIERVLKMFLMLKVFLILLSFVDKSLKLTKIFKQIYTDNYRIRQLLVF